MPKYIFAYHGGGMPETEEEGKRVMAAWGAWMESMGDKLVDGGNPVGMSSTLTVDGLSDGGMVSTFWITQNPRLKLPVDRSRVHASISPS